MRQDKDYENEFAYHEIEISEKSFIADILLNTTYLTCRTLEKGPIPLELKAAIFM